MSLPKKVRDIKNKVDAIEKKGREDADNVNTPNDPAVTAVADQNPAPAVVDASPTIQQENDPQFWKKRFVGMKKAYDEQVPGLRKELERVQGESRLLIQQNANLKTQLEAKPAAPAPQAQKPKEITVDDILAKLPEEDRNKYDSDFFVLMSKILNAVNMNSGSVSLPDNFVNRLDKVEARVQKSDTEEFYDALDSGVPGWEALQATPEMNQWLLTHNDLLGDTPDNVIRSAQASLNAKRIIAIFKMYQNAAPATSAAKPNPLDHLLIPDTTGGGSGKTDVDEVFRASFVKNFYDDVARGKYRGKEKDAASLEKRIIAAQKAGRIKPG